MKKYILIILGILILGGLTYYISYAYRIKKNERQGQEAVQELIEQEPGTEEDEQKTEKIVEKNWRDIEIRDIGTLKEFKISDFDGKNILLETFAVWCPICLDQQKQMAKMEEQDDIIHISLDTDPNEDASLVLKHILKNNFDWIFAISPPDMTRSLVEEFGLEVVNPPSAPVILICANGNSKLLQSRVKSAETLLKEIDEGC